MVNSRRAQKTKSGLPSTKNFLVSLILIFTTLLFISCTTQKTKSPAITPIKLAKKVDQESLFTVLNQITSDGENAYPSFSSNGNELLYTGADKSEHTNSQVYLINLQTQKNTRLTFSDGSVIRPLFDPQNEYYVYSSTTDEEKENPDLNKLITSESASPSNNEVSYIENPTTKGFEIYTRKIKNDQIERFKRGTGYDSAESFVPGKRQLVATSIRKGKSEVYILDLNGRVLKQWHSLAKENMMSPRMFNKDIYWIQALSDGTSEIMKSENGKPGKSLLQRKASLRDLAVNAEGTWLSFSANIDDSENFDIYIMRTDGQCLKRLTYAPTSDINSDWSPDGKKIAFASRRTSTYQIYIGELGPEVLNCN